MQTMITGGERGLGLYLAQRYHADSYSRSSGFDINRDCQDLGEISLDYDIVINNAYDGFGQTLLLESVARHWIREDKTGWIINIGGVGSEDLSPPGPHWQLYNAHKRSLKHMSLQWTHAFRTGQVGFRTSLITVDRLDTPLGRTTPEWTGNGVDLRDVYEMIELCLRCQPNTCIGEIKAWVNLDHNSLSSPNLSM